MGDVRVHCLAYTPGRSRLSSIRGPPAPGSRETGRRGAGRRGAGRGRAGQRRLSPSAWRSFTALAPGGVPRAVTNWSRPSRVRTKTPTRLPPPRRRGRRCCPGCCGNSRRSRRCCWCAPSPGRSGCPGCPRRRPRRWRSPRAVQGDLDAGVGAVLAVEADGPPGQGVPVLGVAPAVEVVPVDVHHAEEAQGGSGAEVVQPEGAVQVVQAVEAVIRALPEAAQGLLAGLQGPLRPPQAVVPVAPAVVVVARSPLRPEAGRRGPVPAGPGAPRRPPPARRVAFCPQPGRPGRTPAPPAPPGACCCARLPAAVPARCCPCVPVRPPSCQ